MKQWEAKATKTLAPQGETNKIHWIMLPQGKTACL